MAKTLNDIENLLSMELNDLYSAEEQIIKALPHMMNAASFDDLNRAFQQHLDQTRQQKLRLDEIFRMLGEQPSGEKCKGMEGIIKEVKDIVKAKGQASVKDAALIASAQRVEHYEMAAYGSARTFAQEMGRSDVADMLQQTLNEEGDTDKQLTLLAEEQINRMAMEVSQQEWQEGSEMAEEAPPKSRRQPRAAERKAQSISRPVGRTSVSRAGRARPQSSTRSKTSRSKAGGSKARGKR